MFSSQYEIQEQRVVLPAHRQFSQLCDAFVGRSSAGTWEVASDSSNNRSDSAAAEACADGHFQTIVAQLKRGMGRGNLPILLVHVPGAQLPSALRIWLASVQGRVVEAREPGAGGGSTAPAVTTPSRSMGANGAASLPAASMAVGAGGAAMPPGLTSPAGRGTRTGDAAVAEAAGGSEDAFVFYHDVGSSRHSTSVRLLLLRMLRQIGGSFGAPFPTDHSSSVPPEDWLAWRVSILLETVSALCAQSREGRTAEEGGQSDKRGGSPNGNNKTVPFQACIIVLTGVHALRSTLFEHLQWLPLVMPPHVRVLLTAPVSVPDALALCPPPKVLTQAGSGGSDQGGTQSNTGGLPEAGRRSSFLQQQLGESGVLGGGTAGGGGGNRLDHLGESDGSGDFGLSEADARTMAAGGGRNSDSIAFAACREAHLSIGLPALRGGFRLVLGGFERFRAWGSALETRLHLQQHEDRLADSEAAAGGGQAGAFHPTAEDDGRGHSAAQSSKQRPSAGNRGRSASPELAPGGPMSVVAATRKRTTASLTFARLGVAESAASTLKSTQGSSKQAAASREQGAIPSAGDDGDDDTAPNAAGAGVSVQSGVLLEALRRQWPVLTVPLEFPFVAAAPEVDVPVLPWSHATDAATAAGKVRPAATRSAMTRRHSMLTPLHSDATHSETALGGQDDQTGDSGVRAPGDTAPALQEVQEDCEVVAVGRCDHLRVKLLLPPGSETASTSSSTAAVRMPAWSWLALLGASSGEWASGIWQRRVNRYVATVGMPPLVAQGAAAGDSPLLQLLRPEAGTQGSKNMLQHLRPPPLMYTPLYVGLQDKGSYITAQLTLLMVRQYRRLRRQVRAAAQLMVSRAVQDAAALLGSREAPGEGGAASGRGGGADSAAVESGSGDSRGSSRGRLSLGGAGAGGGGSQDGSDHGSGGDSGSAGDGGLSVAAADSQVGASVNAAQTSVAGRQAIPRHRGGRQAVEAGLAGLLEDSDEDRYDSDSAGGGFNGEHTPHNGGEGGLLEDSDEDEAALDADSDGSASDVCPSPGDFSPDELLCVGIVDAAEDWERYLLPSTPWFKPAAVQAVSGGILHASATGELLPAGVDMLLGAVASWWAGALLWQALGSVAAYRDGVLRYAIGVDDPAPMEPESPGHVNDMFGMAAPAGAAADIGLEQKLSHLTAALLAPRWAFSRAQKLAKAEAWQGGLDEPWEGGADDRVGFPQAASASGLDAHLAAQRGSDMPSVSFGLGGGLPGDGGAAAGGAAWDASAEHQQSEPILVPLDCVLSDYESQVVGHLVAGVSAVLDGLSGGVTAGAPPPDSTDDNQTDKHESTLEQSAFVGFNSPGDGPASLRVGTQTSNASATGEGRQGRTQQAARPATLQATLAHGLLREFQLRSGMVPQPQATLPILASRLIAVAAAKWGPLTAFTHMHGLLCSSAGRQTLLGNLAVVCARLRESTVPHSQPPRQAPNATPPTQGPEGASDARDPPSHPSRAQQLGTAHRHARIYALVHHASAASHIVSHTLGLVQAPAKGVNGGKTAPGARRPLVGTPAPRAAVSRGSAASAAELAGLTPGQPLRGTSGTVAPTASRTRPQKSTGKAHSAKPSKVNDPYAGQWYAPSLVLFAPPPELAGGGADGQDVVRGLNTTPMGGKVPGGLGAQTPPGVRSPVLLQHGSSRNRTYTSMGDTRATGAVKWQHAVPPAWYAPPAAVGIPAAAHPILLGANQLFVAREGVPGALLLWSLQLEAGSYLSARGHPAGGKAMQPPAVSFGPFQAASAFEPAPKSSLRERDRSYRSTGSLGFGIRAAGGGGGSPSHKAGGSSASLPVGSVSLEHLDVASVFGNLGTLSAAAAGCVWAHSLLNMGQVWWGLPTEAPCPTSAETDFNAPPTEEEEAEYGTGDAVSEVGGDLGLGASGIGFAFGVPASPTGPQNAGIGISAEHKNFLRVPPRDVPSSYMSLPPSKFELRVALQRWMGAVTLGAADTPPSSSLNLPKKSKNKSRRHQLSITAPNAQFLWQWVLYSRSSVAYSVQPRPSRQAMSFCADLMLWHEKAFKAPLHALPSAESGALALSASSLGVKESDVLALLTSAPPPPDKGEPPGSPVRRNVNFTNSLGSTKHDGTGQGIAVADPAAGSIALVVRAPLVAAALHLRQTGGGSGATALLTTLRSAYTHVVKGSVAEKFLPEGGSGGGYAPPRRPRGQSPSPVGPALPASPTTAAAAAAAISQGHHVAVAAADLALVRGALTGEAADELITMHACASVGIAAARRAWVDSLQALQHEMDKWEAGVHKGSKGGSAAKDDPSALFAQSRSSTRQSVRPSARNTKTGHGTKSQGSELAEGVSAKECLSALLMSVPPLALQAMLCRELPWGLFVLLANREALPVFLPEAEGGAGGLAVPKGGLPAESVHGSGVEAGAPAHMQVAAGLMSGALDTGGGASWEEMQRVLTSPDLMLQMWGADGQVMLRSETDTTAFKRTVAERKSGEARQGVAGGTLALRSFTALGAVKDGSSASLDEQVPKGGLVRASWAKMFQARTQKTSSGAGTIFDGRAASAMGSSAAASRSASGTGASAAGASSVQGGIHATGSAAPEWIAQLQVNGAMVRSEIARVAPWLTGIEGSHVTAGAGAFTSLPHSAVSLGSSSTANKGKLFLASGMSVYWQLLQCRATQLRVSRSAVVGLSNDEVNTGWGASLGNVDRGDVESHSDLLNFPEAQQTHSVVRDGFSRISSSTLSSLDVTRSDLLLFWGVFSGSQKAPGRGDVATAPSVLSHLTALLHASLSPQHIASMRAALTAPPGAATSRGVWSESPSSSPTAQLRSQGLNRGASFKLSQPAASQILQSYISRFVPFSEFVRASGSVAGLSPPPQLTAAASGPAAQGCADGSNVTAAMLSLSAGLHSAAGDCDVEPGVASVLLGRMLMDHAHLAVRALPGWSKGGAKAPKHVFDPEAAASSLTLPSLLTRGDALLTHAQNGPAMEAAAHHAFEATRWAAFATASALPEARAAAVAAIAAREAAPYLRQPVSAAAAAAADKAAASALKAVHALEGSVAQARYGLGPAAAVLFRFSAGLSLFGHAMLHWRTPVSRTGTTLGRVIPPNATRRLQLLFHSDPVLLFNRSIATWMERSNNGSPSMQTRTAVLATVGALLFELGTRTAVEATTENGAIAAATAAAASSIAGVLDDDGAVNELGEAADERGLLGDDARALRALDLGDDGDAGGGLLAGVEAGLLEGGAGRGDGHEGLLAPRVKGLPSRAAGRLAVRPGSADSTDSDSEAAAAGVAMLTTAAGGGGGVSDLRGTSENRAVGTKHATRYGRVLGAWCGASLGVWSACSGWTLTPQELNTLAQPRRGPWDDDDSDDPLLQPAQTVGLYSLAGGWLGVSGGAWQPLSIASVAPLLNVACTLGGEGIPDIPYDRLLGLAFGTESASDSSVVSSAAVADVGSKTAGGSGAALATVDVTLGQSAAAAAAVSVLASAAGGHAQGAGRAAWGRAGVFSSPAAASVSGQGHMNAHSVAMPPDIPPDTVIIPLLLYFPLTRRNPHGSLKFLHRPLPSDALGALGLRGLLRDYPRAVRPRKPPAVGTLFKSKNTVQRENMAAAKSARRQDLAEREAALEAKTAAQPALPVPTGGGGSSEEGSPRHGNLAVVPCPAPRSAVLLHGRKTQKPTSRSVKLRRGVGAEVRVTVSRGATADKQHRMNVQLAASGAPSPARTVSVTQPLAPIRQGGKGGAASGGNTTDRNASRIESTGSTSTQGMSGGLKILFRHTAAVQPSPLALPAVVAVLAAADHHETAQGGHAEAPLSRLLHRDDWAFESSVSLESVSDGLALYRRWIWCHWLWLAAGLHTAPTLSRLADVVRGGVSMPAPAAPAGVSGVLQARNKLKALVARVPAAVPPAGSPARAPRSPSQDRSQRAAAVISPAAPAASGGGQESKGLTSFVREKQLLSVLFGGGSEAKGPPSPEAAIEAAELASHSSPHSQNTGTVGEYGLAASGADVSGVGAISRLDDVVAATRAQGNRAKLLQTLADVRAGLPAHSFNPQNGLAVTRAELQTMATRARVLRLREHCDSLKKDVATTQASITYQESYLTTAGRNNDVASAESSAAHVMAASLEMRESAVDAALTVARRTHAWLKSVLKTAEQFPGRDETYMEEISSAIATLKAAQHSLGEDVVRMRFDIARVLHSTLPDLKAAINHAAAVRATARSKFTAAAEKALNAKAEEAERAEKQATIKAQVRNKAQKAAHDARVAAAYELLEGALHKGGAGGQQASTESHDSAQPAPAQGAALLLSDLRNADGSLDGEVVIEVLHPERITSLGPRSAAVGRNVGNASHGAAQQGSAQAAGRSAAHSRFTSHKRSRSSHSSGGGGQAAHGPAASVTERIMLAVVMKRIGMAPGATLESLGKRHQVAQGLRDVLQGRMRYVLGLYTHWAQLAAAGSHELSAQKAQADADNARLEARGGGMGATWGGGDSFEVHAMSGVLGGLGDEGGEARTKKRLSFEMMFDPAVSTYMFGQGREDSGTGAVSRRDIARTNGSAISMNTGLAGSDDAGSLQSPSAAGAGRSITELSSASGGQRSRGSSRTSGTAPGATSALNGDIDAMEHDNDAKVVLSPLQIALGQLHRALGRDTAITWPRYEWLNGTGAACWGPLSMLEGGVSSSSVDTVLADLNVLFGEGIVGIAVGAIPFLGEQSRGDFLWQAYTSQLRVVDSLTKHVAITRTDLQMLLHAVDSMQTARRRPAGGVDFDLPAGEAPEEVDVSESDMAALRSIAEALAEHEDAVSLLQSAQQVMQPKRSSRTGGGSDAGTATTPRENNEPARLRELQSPGAGAIVRAKPRTLAEASTRVEGEVSAALRTEALRTALASASTALRARPIDRLRQRAKTLQARTAHSSAMLASLTARLRAVCDWGRLVHHLSRTGMSAVGAMFALDASWAIIALEKAAEGTESLQAHLIPVPEGAPPDTSAAPVLSEPPLTRLSQGGVRQAPLNRPTSASAQQSPTHLASGSAHLGTPQRQSRRRSVHVVSDAQRKRRSSAAIAQSAVADFAERADSCIGGIASGMFAVVAAMGPYGPAAVARAVSAVTTWQGSEGGGGKGGRSGPAGGSASYFQLAAAAGQVGMDTRPHTAAMSLRPKSVAGVRTGYDPASPQASLTMNAGEPPAPQAADTTGDTATASSEGWEAPDMVARGTAGLECLLNATVTAVLQKALLRKGLLDPRNGAYNAVHLPSVVERVSDMVRAHDEATQFDAAGRGLTTPLSVPSPVGRNEDFRTVDFNSQPAVTREEAFLQHRLFQSCIVAREALVHAAEVLHKRKLHRAARCILTALAFLVAPDGGGVIAMAKMLRTLDSAARLANMSAHSALGGSSSLHHSGSTLDLTGDTLAALQALPPPPDFAEGVRTCVVQQAGLFDPLESASSDLPPAAVPSFNRQGSAFAVGAAGSGAPVQTVDSALLALVRTAKASQPRAAEVEVSHRGGAYSPPSPLQEGPPEEPPVPVASLLGGSAGAAMMTPRSRSRFSSDGDGPRFAGGVRATVKAVDSPGLDYEPSAARQPDRNASPGGGDAEGGDSGMHSSQSDALLGSGHKVGAIRRAALAQLSMLAHTRHSATVAQLPAYLLGLRTDGEGQVLPAEIRRYTAGGKVRVRSDEARAVPPSLRSGTFQYRYIMGYEWGETKDTGAGAE